MSTEEPKILHGHQREKTEQKILSDATLIKKGAEIKEDGRLEVTEKQVDKTREEGRPLESTCSFEASIPLGSDKGVVDFAMGWSKEYGEYIFEIASPAFKNYTILIGENTEIAKRVYESIYREEITGRHEAPVLYQKALEICKSLLPDKFQNN